MIHYQELILIFVIHWFADFVLQSNWMASNKSKSNRALLAHISVYTLVLCIINPLWALINGILHGITDYFTSRWTSRLWAKQDTHNFFVVIGLDQCIHAITLVITYFWIVL